MRSDLLRSRSETAPAVREAVAGLVIFLILSFMRLTKFLQALRKVDSMEFPQFEQERWRMIENKGQSGMGNFNEKTTGKVSVPAKKPTSRADLGASTAEFG